MNRIAALARSQRSLLIRRQHLLAIAHERDRTPTLFLPVQQKLAAELAESRPHRDPRRTGAAGRAGARDRLCGDAVLGRAGPRHQEEDPSLWTADWPDQALVAALQSPTDYDAVFEYGLEAMLAPLSPGRQTNGRVRATRSSSA